MKKVLTIALIIINIANGNLYAQSIGDPNASSRGTADGRKLKLSKVEREKFKADKRNYNSDLFKPQARFVSDTTLLRDSSYVKSYRKAAYKSALKTRTAGHYILIYGSITVVAVIINLVIQSASDNTANSIKNFKE